MSIDGIGGGNPLDRLEALFAQGVKPEVPQTEAKPQNLGTTQNSNAVHPQPDTSAANSPFGARTQEQQPAQRMWSPSWNDTTDDADNDSIWADDGINSSDGNDDDWNNSGSLGNQAQSISNGASVQPGGNGTVNTGNYGSTVTNGADAMSHDAQVREIERDLTRYGIEGDMKEGLVNYAEQSPQNATQLGNLIETASYTDNPKEIIEVVVNYAQQGDKQLAQAEFAFSKVFDKVGTEGMMTMIEIISEGSSDAARLDTALTNQDLQTTLSIIRENS